MHQHAIDQWQHDHDYAPNNAQGERRTRLVLWLTLVTMVAEIAAGSYYGSMALLADGWHMGTHVAAFMIALFAYRYARKHAENPDFSFGTGKVNVLGGFASAVALAVVALLMAVESLQRLWWPEAIQFDQALVVAAIGLLVNLASAWLLHGGEHGHRHQHEYEHHDHHEHEHHDHNLRATYVHVLADALTSLLAIAALLAGKYVGWQWLDPAMGLVGALIITRWALGLLRDTSPILLDVTTDVDMRLAIVDAIEADRDSQVVDLHLWQLAAGQQAAIVSLVTHAANDAEHYKARLRHLPWLAHVTVEVNHCPGEH